MILPNIESLFIIMYIIIVSLSEKVIITSLFLKIFLFFIYTRVQAI